MLYCYDMCSETVLCVFLACVLLPLINFLISVLYNNSLLNKNIVFLFFVTSYCYSLMTTDRIIVTFGIKLATMYDPAIDEMSVYRTI